MPNVLAVSASRSVCRRRLKLSGHTGLRVSALCLSAMTFGETRAWSADKSASQAVFERFAERGGNFIDTANNYKFARQDAPGPSTLARTRAAFRTPRADCT